MPEVMLEWLDALNVSYLPGGGVCGPVLTRCLDEMWRCPIHGLNVKDTDDRDSAKAAVITELLRRNEQERLALEDLK